MPIIKSSDRKRFVVVDGATADDNRLSFSARGVILYLLSKPGKWIINFDDVQNAGNIGRDQRRRIFNELEKFGYFERRRFRIAETGKFDYELIFRETPKNPQSENPSTVKTQQNTVDVFTVDGRPSYGEPYSGEPSTVNTSVLVKNDLDSIDLVNNKRVNNKKTKTDELPRARNQRPDNLIFSAPFAPANFSKVWKCPKQKHIAAFQIIANLCFNIPLEKWQLVKGVQAGKVQIAICDLLALEADLKLLKYFSDFWKNDWRSLDRKYNKFQAPRPEQFAQIWFEFAGSSELTKIRKDIEENANKNKSEITTAASDTGNGRGRGNKFDSVEQYDYTQFANITFD